MSEMDELGEMFGVTFNESKIAAVLREHEERLKELESRFTFQLAVDAEDRAMKAESRVLELEAQVKSLQVERSESDYESGVADGFRAGQASSPFPVQVKSLKQANHRLEARVNAANGESLEYKVGYESALRKIAELLSLLRLLGECQEHGADCLPFYEERVKWLLDKKAAQQDAAILDYTEAEIEYGMPLWLMQLPATIKDDERYREGSTLREAVLLRMAKEKEGEGCITQ